MVESARSRGGSQLAARRATPLGMAVALLLLGGMADDTHAVLGFDPLHGVITAHDDTLTVKVTIDETVTDLRGFSLGFEIDPTIVNVFAAHPGSLMVNAGCPIFFYFVKETASDESIEVDAATLGCSMVGPGDILLLKFSASGNEGLSPLDCLPGGRLRDSFNNPIPFTCPDDADILFDIVGVDDENVAPEVIPVLVGPNPTGRLRTLDFFLERSMPVRVELLSATGRRIWFWRGLSSGRTTLDWSDADSDVSPLPNGVYFYRVAAGRAVTTGKITLLR